MDDLELIFSMLGEASTTAITKARDTKGLEENKVAARQGGEVAGNARRELESKTGESVVLSENFLDVPETQENLQRFSGPQKSKISAELKKKRKKLLGAYQENM